VTRLRPIEPVRELPDPITRQTIRVAAGLSRRAMAEQLGCHEQTIIRWEAGTRVVSGRYYAAYSALLARLDAKQVPA
jgi:transcriptional regulator with XRE-family HTH domain